MTETSNPDRKDWAERLDHASRAHDGDLAAIEILDQTYGDEEEAERVPFGYASYDPKDDVVIIAVGGRSGRFPVALRHIVNHPVEVDVAESALRVIADDGTVTLVTFTKDAG